jgi:hypothetical protein
MLNIKNTEGSPMNNKFRIYLVIIILAVISFPICAYADQAIDMIKISCIPEANYFDVELKMYHSLVNEDETVVKQPINRTKSKSKILAKHGIYFPRNLVYECKLPNATYKIKGSQPMPSPRGQCSASPTPSISIWGNGVLWIENVLFGEDCFGNPTIKRIEIADGNMSLYIKISDETLFDPILFEYSPSIPVKQDSINKFIEFDTSYQLYKSKLKKN